MVCCCVWVMVLKLLVLILSGWLKMYVVWSVFLMFFWCIICVIFLNRLLWLVCLFLVWWMLICKVLLIRLWFVWIWLCWNMNVVGLVVLFRIMVFVLYVFCVVWKRFVFWMVWCYGWVKCVKLVVLLRFCKRFIICYWYWCVRIVFRWFMVFWDCCK